MIQFRVDLVQVIQRIPAFCARCIHNMHEYPASLDMSQEIMPKTGAIRRAFDRGARRFYCGGAEGFDLLAGKLVLLENERHLDIQLVLLLPYTGFGEAFTAQDRAELLRQKKAAEEVLYLSNHYFSGCMALRNRQLVEDADLCIAYLRRAPSGTAQTVSFAKEKGIEVEYV